MSRPRSGRVGTVVAVVALVVGLFGTALAISGLASPLARPAAGGTCGPGLGSEAAAVAFFDPVTIGAGTEPSASRPRAHAQWIAFVHDCQAAADQRVAITLPVLVVSVILVVGSGFVLWRRRRPDDDHHPTGGGTAPPATYPAPGPPAVGTGPVPLVSATPEAPDR